MKIKKKSSGAVIYDSASGVNLKGWDADTQTYYGDGVKIRRASAGINVVSGAAQKKEVEQKKVVASPGGTFLGGWKQPEAKEKKALTAAEIAAQQKEAEDAAKYVEYLKALDLDEQQKKIDTLQGEANREPTYNIHAFGAYDPKNLTETETELAKAQEDYNFAESIQYREKGDAALSALDADTQQLIDIIARYNIDARSLRGNEVGENDERERTLTALMAKGLTAADIEQLVDYRVRQINDDEYTKKVKEIEELASSEDYLGIRDMGAIVASAKSVPLNLASGAGYLDLLMQQAHNAQMGYDRPLDYKTGAMSLYGQAVAARSTVSQRIMDNAETEVGGQVGAFLYQTGMSMADSAVVATLGGLGLGASGTLLLGGSAATAAAVDAKNRGGSDSQALMSGAFAGAAEAVFEKFSIENLLKTNNVKNILGGEFKQLVSDIGRQGVVEGSEELFTEFANFISDRIIMGGSSSYEQSVRDYMAQGMTEEEARQKAAIDFAADCATAFVGGLISGGVMGGVVSASRMDSGNYDALRSSLAEMYAQDTLNVAPESAAATQVMEKVAAGRTVKGGDLRKVVKENQKAIDKARRESAMAEIEERKKPPTAQVENLTLSDGRTVKSYTTDEDGTPVWVTDNGNIKGGKTDNTVVGKANKWGGSIGRTIVEQYDGMDEESYANAADALVEFGIHSVDNRAFEWANVVEMPFTDTVGLDRAFALYNAGVSAARGNGFRAYYHAGALGNEFTDVQVKGKSWLNDEVKKMAYELGQEAAKNEAERKAVTSEKAGFNDTSEAAKKLSKKTRATLDRIGKALGVEIRFATESDKMSEQENGRYVSGTATIIISPNAANPTMVVVAHEVTHRMQEMYGKEYKAYRRYVVNKIEGSTGTLSITAIRDRYSEYYRNVGRIDTFSDLDAADELVADYTRAMIEDGTLFRELANENRSIARRLLDALKRVINQLTGKQEFTLYGTSANELREAQRMWEKMVNGEQTQQNEGNVWSDIVGTKHSLKDSDGRQLSEAQTEFFKDSKVRDENGNLMVMYHGTNTPNFTVFDPRFSDDKTSLFFTSDPDVANTYTTAQDYGRDVDPYNLITAESSAEQFNKAQERVGGGLRVVKVTPEWIAQMKAKAKEAKQDYISQVSKIADEIESASRGEVAIVFDYHLKNLRDELASGKIWGSGLGLSLGNLRDSLTLLRNRKLERSLYDKMRDVGEIRNTVRAYEDAIVEEEDIGQYVYTETNSMVPFVARGKTDAYFTHIIPGTEREMVEKAIDRMKWVQEHNLGNRYKVYLNIANPYVVNAGTDISGKMDRVTLSRDYYDSSWRVELESGSYDNVKYMTTADFEAFVETAFDAETSAKIKAQIEEDNNAYLKEWGDLDPDYVDHDIQLENVSISYVEPGNWNDLYDSEVSEYFDWDEEFPLKTRDVAQFAKENGYDGVIFKNMKDVGGYAAFKGRGASTIAIAFDSNQVKSTNNLNPTEDPDIRYSLNTVGAEMDSDYLAAVKRGDMETAQRMVDHMAFLTGYTTKLHHGTAGEPFYVFRQGAEGIHFGTLAQATKRAEVAKERVGFRREKYTAEDIRKNTGRYPNTARQRIIENILTVYPVSFTREESDAAADLAYGDKQISDSEFLSYIDRAEREANVSSYMISNRDMLKNDSQRVVTAWVKAHHPVVFDVDIGEWTPGNMASILIDKINGQKTEIYNPATSEWEAYDPQNITGIELTKEDIPVLETMHRYDDFGRMAAFLEGKGADSIQYLNTYEGESPKESYILLSPEQIKSADPVTYDDNGDVIPLSERFNTENNDIRFSLSRNAELMQIAEDYNNSHLAINLDTAREQRQAIYDFMMANLDRLKLPEDIEGNTAIKNSSYDITEENTTVCIRSMAADALCDAIAEALGRPLTVQDTLLISQDLMNYTDEPECVYCYVATDRRAYREFLGSYYKQMQSAIEALKEGKLDSNTYTAEQLGRMTEEQKSNSLYWKFLNGRKPTKNMANRFELWKGVAKGGKMISAKDLASEKMMQEAMKDPALAAQVKDARAYAQSASWAKKRIGYHSYNGHILNWTQRRINDLNKHYGLRFYSFSDFSPAFILENMQQMTDAAVRGLKGLAYTKVLDFAEIFAPTGININISVFGYSQGKSVAQDGMMGADWKSAQDLRKRYENVGITFVATNDSQIEWALEQDWIDVVIPYHLVRTGQAVAKHFGYTNYTAESGDTKGANWKKGDKKTIYPSEHNNDKQTYLDALKKANLEPRFARWVDHPNYMKLVNETRRSASDTPPIQAKFNVDAAKDSLERMMKQGGYFVPIGGDYENMQDIATEIADKIGSKMSLKSDAAMGRTLRDMAEAEGATKDAVKRWIVDVHRGKKVNVNIDEAERVAQNLINDYRSSADKYDVMGAVLDLFNYLQNGDGNRDIDGATVQAKANAVADALLSAEMRGRYYAADFVETPNGMELSDLAQDNEELRRFLRETKIVFPKEYVSDLGTETWTAFKDGIKGAQARLADENNRANVDTLYREEFSRMWPQYFPDSITGEAAMLQRIAEVSQRVFERTNRAHSETEIQAMMQMTSSDILDRFFNLPQVGKTYMSVRNLRDKSMRAVRNLQDQLQVRDTQSSRASIVRKVKALDKKLRDNTEKSHVPDYLRSAVLELCSLFTQNTSVFTKSQLAVIKLQYDALAKDENMQYVHDEEISDVLEELANTLDGRRLSQLTAEELQWVNDVVSHFSHLVNNANQAFLDDKRVAVTDMANKVLSKAVTDGKRASLPVPKLLASGNIKPYYFFKDIGGQMESLFADLLRGQSRYGLLMNAAESFRRQMYEKYNASKWLDSDKKLEMNTEHGDHIVLNVGEALSILATYKREVTNREQDAGHLSLGGIVYEDEMQREIDNNKTLSVKKLINKVLQKPDAKAKPISMGDVLEISRWLHQNVSANAEAFVDEMVGYLSTDMAELGNETSMKLTGIRKYNERYYFPYKVSSVYLATKLRDPKESPALRRPGFSKRTQRKANNPIVLRGFMDVWSEHVSEMLTYSTMAVPQDTMLRVLNYNDTLVDVEDSTNIYKNVKEAIQNAYGKHALEYIEQLLRDMNGGVAVDEREKTFGSLVRIYKKNAVGLSLSVAIQQPTSAVRAMAEVDPKYFFGVSLAGNYEELKKYSGVAVIKEMGGFDTNLGRGGASWLKGDESIMEQAIGFLPQKMDQVTWAYLWNVVKAETRDKHPELLDNGKETEAFLEAAGKRFDEVVEKTQVYDSVLTRSENMRSKSGLANIFLSFMSEPMVTLNMATDAIRSKDAKRISRVAGTLLISIVLNNIVKALWTAGRDDDEEKTYLEKLMYRFNNYMSGDINPLNYIPIVKDFDDIRKGYGASIELLEPLTDAVEKYQAAAEQVQDFGVSGVFSEETMDFLLALPSLAGIPLDNVKRDVETIINLATKMAPIDSATKRDILNAFNEGWGASSSVKDTLRDGWRHRNNERKRKNALAEIEELYQDKVRYYQDKGKTLEEARKSAKSSIQSSCTSYLKSLYQNAEGVKKNEVKQFALRIGVGGKQLYAGYDFSKWDE